MEKNIFCFYHHFRDCQYNCPLLECRDLILTGKYTDNRGRETLKYRAPTAYVGNSGAGLMARLIETHTVDTGNTLMEMHTFTEAQIRKQGHQSEPQGKSMY